MTYGECKEKIRDLGFEDDTTMGEYMSIVSNAVHRAMQFIFDDIVIKLKSYYKRELSTEEIEWTPVRPQKITIDTEEDEKLELPDNVIELVPLLASHYVWLDDDQVKAALYWNSFDSMKQEVLTACKGDVKAVIYGGMRW
jgi:hypothetical protein